jgi:hypothetical protein
VGKAWDEVSASFERFCLAAGIEALGAMMEGDAEEACGPRHARGTGRRGHRWGRPRGKIGLVDVERPRVRDLAGKELALPSLQQAVDEDWLGKWAMNLMLINVSTRKFRRAVRLPEGDVPAPAGSGAARRAVWGLSSPGIGNRFPSRRAGRGQKFRFTVLSCTSAPCGRRSRHSSFVAQFLIVTAVGPGRGPT